MKSFNDIEGVDEFVKAYSEYEKRFVVDGARFSGDWIKYVTKFLNLNLPKAKMITRCKIATIQRGISFTEIERFVESIQNFEVDEIVFDPVNSSFTFYGNKK